MRGDLHDLIYIFLHNGVMTTPKRRILTFVFTVLCFNNNDVVECSAKKRHDEVGGFRTSPMKVSKPKKHKQKKNNKKKKNR